MEEEEEEAEEEDEEDEEGEERDTLRVLLHSVWRRRLEVDAMMQATLRPLKPSMGIDHAHQESLPTSQQPLSTNDPSLGEANCEAHQCAWLQSQR
ncbi:MAG: hypothetical protein VXW22_17420, partial [Pseudomonadota bacterium]|nr:hypothetical protein [Pseudomonadota bacterium]